MGKTLDLGRRLELEPMDTHCQNASLALYGQDVAGVTNFLVHTYSKIEDATQRVAFMNQALIVMVGLEESDDSPEIRFEPLKPDDDRLRIIESMHDGQPVCCLRPLT